MADAPDQTRSVRLPTRYGDFDAVAFRFDDGAEHLAIVAGGAAGLAGDVDVLVRLHSSCLTGDVFGSRRCDCGPQLDAALARIALEGHGVVVYLQQEGRGIGLFNKIRAYHEQENGANTVEANERLGFHADARSYEQAAQMLEALGVRSVRLMTNNPAKVEGLRDAGVEVTQRIPHHVGTDEFNRSYLDAKRDLMGHYLA